MLLKVKIIELLRHIELIELSCKTLSISAHPNLRLRIQNLSEYILFTIRPAAEELLSLIDSYEQASNSAIDTWRQLYGYLTGLAATTQMIRIQEIPSHLASTNDDLYFSNLLQALHSEVGLTDIRPVVSLHQNSWFAVVSWFPITPLYYLPFTIRTDISELPLIFHEIGHVLFRLWGDSFSKVGEDVIKDLLIRKTHEISSDPDPSLRAENSTILRQKYTQLLDESEELICDIVGVLLGGEAFVVALSVGLFCVANSNPYDHKNRLYPPLDCRMRLAQRAAKYVSLDSKSITTLEESWQKVCAIHLPERWYRLIYDDMYLDSMISAVAKYLTSKGLFLITTNNGGIRGQLIDGMRSMVLNSAEHSEWINTYTQQLRTVYSSPNSS